MRRLDIIFLAAVILISTTGISAQEKIPKLGEKDIVVLNEALNLRKEAATQIWPGINDHPLPYLLRTENYEYLVNHPSPGENFTEFKDGRLGGDVFVKAREDSNIYMAAYPYLGEWTIVIDLPREDEAAAIWSLIFVHESFHVYQNFVRNTRIINPFVGQYNMNHEMNFPFEYESGVFSSAYRLESEFLFDAITADQAPDTTMLLKLLGHAENIERSVAADSLHYLFKQWMEWNEGIARYTEREVAAIAADKKRYTPTEKFAELFPEDIYQKAWEARYENMLNPVRFVGDGVTGRGMFYYAGMAKGYLLDRLKPGWKKDYFERGLDEMIFSLSKE